QLIAQKLDSCMDLNPQEIALNVSPAGSGTIALDGSTKTPYVWKKIIEADTIINLAATPAGQYWFFDHCEKYEVSNVFSPDTLTDIVYVDFQKKDSFVAFFRYFNPDSLNVGFDVSPPGKGNISINASLISSYPALLKLDRRFTYNLTATPVANWKF